MLLEEPGPQLQLPLQLRRAASDLGLPFVAVGLLYQKGYFQQYLNADGWQQEQYPVNDFYTMPIERALRVFSSDGAEKYAMTAETTISSTARTMLCQRKIVSVSGITPVIGSSAGGIIDFVAIIIAGEDERPSDQTLPRPR